MPLLLNVRRGDIAERAIIVGDPARVWQVGGLLKELKVVNENRGFIVVTGRYNGIDVSIACHGIGAPSAAMLLEELIMYGVKIIVRLGTMGAIDERLNLKDVIVVMASAYNQGGIYWQYLRSGIIYPLTPDFILSFEIARKLKEVGLNVHMGIVYSSDAFYAEEDLVPELRSKGVLGVDMETAAVFLVSKLRNVRAASTLIVSNKLYEGRSARVLTSEELKDVVMLAGKAILEVITGIK